jgi:TOBE domain
MISIRPEAVRVEREGAGANRDGVASLPETVSDLVYAGNSCDAFVDVAGIQVRAQLLHVELSQLSVGDKVNAVSRRAARGRSPSSRPLVSSKPQLVKASNQPRHDQVAVV